ncbi:MAG TPA: hypothetical protein VN643_06600 [Pyrinomonadaceae bacterium]|nr:hypothetical protein [Pyrinomonadaceae bacterium]
MNDHKHTILTSIRWATLALAIFNLLALFARVGSVHFRYWADAFGLALLIIIAAVFVVLDRRWSDLLAVFVTLPMVVWFGYVALGVHGLLPLSANQRLSLADAASWRQLLWNHPEVLLQYAAAFVVLLVATVRFVHSFRLKHVSLQRGA